MQLLYFWFSSTYPEIIKEQGGNLSSAYDFILEKTSQGKYLLSNNPKWQGRASVFEDECIENISAIVGNNGAGKTTILRMLMNIRNLDRTVGLPDNISFHPLEFILIFEDDTGLYIYTSILDLDYSNISVSDKKIYLHTPYTLEDTPFKSHTMIYLTNSSYTHRLPGNVVDEDGLHLLILTASRIESLSKKFYERLLGLEGMNRMRLYMEPYSLATNMIQGDRTVQNFQQFVDIVYWNEIIRKRKWPDYPAKLSSSVGVWIEPITHILKRYLEEERYIGGSKSWEFLVPADEGNLVPVIRCFLPNEPYQIRILYLNLICEIIWAFPRLNKVRTVRLDRVQQAVQRLSQYSCTVNEEWQVEKNTGDKMPFSNEETTFFWPDRENTLKISALNAWILKRLKEAKHEDYSKDNIRYFCMALKEILSYRTILKDGIDITETGYVISLESNGWFGLTEMNSMVIFHRTPEINNMHPDPFDKLLEFFSKKIESGSSFLLRYVSVSNLSMSSGERAFQNFFSWMTVVPRLMANQKKEENWSLKENLLVMVDEAELYMHPQWQKSLIENLRSRLKESYSDKKIQVIITTHSPLCLSDFPRENCIYIEHDRKNNMHNILPRIISKEEQIFGREIYAILRDGFFLKGSPMGDFANNYITALLKKIHDTYDSLAFLKEVNPDLSVKNVDGILNDLQKQVMVIGNIPLRRKIERMIKELRGWAIYVLVKSKD